ncbi:MAG: transposase [Dehalococcoidia bacterium]
MPYDPTIHHRRSIRLRDYDYRAAGAYFVTIVTHQRLCLFGQVDRGAMVLNDLGFVVAEQWRRLTVHYPYAAADSWVVMPNHCHGIVMLSDVSQAAGRKAGLPEVIRGFKSFSAQRINSLRGSSGSPVWQRNYYERIIRNEAELRGVREYIAANPAGWESDIENPQHRPQ